MIKISVPNDDSVALFHFGKSLIDMSSAVEGSPYWVVITQREYDDLKAFQRLKQATEDLMQAAPAMLQENNVDGSIEIYGKRKDVPVDTTSEQVESLATTDSTGTPWDDRIHSASKALNSDGTWRVRRKPKDMDGAEWGDFVEMVKADLQYPVECGGEEPDEEYDSTDPIAIIAKATECLKRDEPPVTPQGDDFHVDAGEVTEQEVASIPAPPPPPVPFAELNMTLDVPNPPTVVSVTAELSYTFPQVMQFLTERHGRITSPQVDQIIADMGLNSIMDIRDNTEHAAPFIARVKALLGE